MARADPGDLEFSTPKGWRRVAPLGKDMVFAVQKGNSIFTVRKLDHRYNNKELENRVDAQREKFAARGIQTQTAGLMTDPRGFIGVMSWFADKSAFFGCLATESSSYEVMLQNSSEEEFGEAMSGVLPPTSSAIDANPALRVIPRLHYALGGMLGSFPNPPGYEITPIEGGGLLAKGDGFALILDPASLKKFGDIKTGEHEGKSQILNGAGQTLFDPKQCGENGMIPVVHGKESWLFRLFGKCSGKPDSAGFVVGYFSLGRSERFAIAGRTTGELSEKAMLAWARLTSFQIPDTDVAGAAAAYSEAMKAIKAEDFVHARTLLQPSADLGDPKAEYNLALIYEESSGMLKDMNQAIRWYQKAADQGYDPAEYNLGAIYYNGEGVDHDYSKALPLFQDAAARGDAEAAQALGTMYMRGLGVPKSKIEALKWFLKAAAIKKLDSKAPN